MKLIDLLGVKIKYFTLKEELIIANQFLYSGGLNTISYISTQMLLEAVENPEIKKLLEEKDMIIYGDVPILEACNMYTKNLIREIETNEFLTEFIKTIVRNNKKIFLIGKDQKGLDELEELLSCLDDNLKIANTYIMEIDGTNLEAMINEINDVVPHVVISKLPFPFQDQLVQENKKLVNANIWLTLNEHLNLKPIKKKKGFYFTKILDKKLFKQKINQYNIKKNGV